MERLEVVGHFEVGVSAADRRLRRPRFSASASEFAFEGEWMQIRRAIASIAEGNSEKEKELLGRVKLTIPSPIVYLFRLMIQI